MCKAPPPETRLNRNQNPTSAGAWESHHRPSPQDLQRWRSGPVRHSFPDQDPEVRHGRAARRWNHRALRPTRRAYHSVGSDGEHELKSAQLLMAQAGGEIRRESRPATNLITRGNVLTTRRFMMPSVALLSPPPQEERRGRAPMPGAAGRRHGETDRPQRPAQRVGRCFVCFRKSRLRYPGRRNGGGGEGRGAEQTAACCRCS